MITLTFNLDYEKMAKNGITEADMLEPMRQHSRKYGIKEIRKGVFAKDGEDAMCVIGMYVVDITEQNTDYIRYLKTWIYERDGCFEDCKQEIIKHYKKEGITYIE